jgi:hypothetical protein
MELYDLLHQMTQTLERLNIPYLITGSVASMAYGEPRLTNDIDIVAGIDEGRVGDLVAAFPPGEFYISGDMIRQAVRERGQFNIIHPASGIKVDIMIPRDSPFDRSRFSRVRRITTAEHRQANFASPEDVIIKKMEYYREGGSEKHLRDITGIIKISGKELDHDYILDWTGRLGLTKIWDAIQKRMREPS